MTKTTENELVVPVHFRWPVRQTADYTVQVIVPLGGMEPILNPRWVEQERLTDSEVDTASQEAIRALVIVK